MASSFKNDETTVLPFLPKYEHEQCRNISIWWFESTFSQNLYGNPSVNCQACTLIALLTASRIAKNKLNLLAKHSKISQSVIMAFAAGIVQGNKIYQKLFDQDKLPAMTLTIPEAMNFAKSYLSNLHEWNAFVYVQFLATNLQQSINERFTEWKNYRGSDTNFDYLFVVAISNSRSILFVFQEEPSTITLFDSHQHTEDRGSLVAQVCMEYLDELLEWTGRMFIQVYKCDPNIFELSFIEIKK